MSEVQEDNSERKTTQYVADQQKGQKVRCICGYYQDWFRPQHWRLNVQLLGSKLAGHWVDETRSLPVKSLQHQVDLKVMSRQGLTMPGIAKMTLSVILAYSLFYLYGGPWSRGRWKRDHIVFFVDDNNKIPMRPFLKTPVSSQSHKGKEAAREEIHRYPEFLELAIMLLEINYGQSLESMLSMDECIQSLNDSWCAASEVFNHRKLDIEKPGLRRAIALCLKPDFGMDFANHGAPDHDNVRSKLMKDVVQPLEQDLEYAFKDFISVDGLDDEAPKILLPFTRPEADSAPAIASPVKGGDDTHLRRKDRNTSSSSPPAKRTKLGVFPGSDVADNFALFNNETRMAGSSSSELTDQWTQRFSQLARSHISEDCGRRLRVAILDTGINSAHPEFYEESRIKALRSWTDNPPDVDLSGHGTHIASTLLSLSFNIDLYIGKVTETNTLKNTGDIADAIRFANEEWDVDILSLSFGLPNGDAAIQEAIDQAVARNKIVFAAASNDGSNTARAYPASHDRVIAVHSADGLGNRSSFNPTPVEHDDNFCVVGEQLEGAWPGGGVRRMSGTSFAVPVSISIASFMIGYIRKNGHDQEKWLVPLLSYEGVRAIFQILSERRDRGYDLVNPLAHFSGSGSSGEALVRAVEKRLDR